MAKSIPAVDEDAGVLGSLTEFLTVNGYEVLTSQNAGDALMLLAVSSPDVVLLDIGMPGFDGLAALQRIHAIHPQMPVMATSTTVSKWATSNGLGT